MLKKKMKKINRRRFLPKPVNSDSTQDNIIDLNSFRNKNMAKIHSARKIFEEMDNPNNILAVGFYISGKNESPHFMATSKINPLEAAGLLLNFASQCSQKGSFDEEEKPPLVSEEDKPKQH